MAPLNFYLLQIEKTQAVEFYVPKTIPPNAVSLFYCFVERQRWHVPEDPKLQIELRKFTRLDE